MKRYAPATARNSEPIARVLETELPERGTVLEIASGSGEHAVFLARRFPHLVWQPTDLDTEALESIAAWSEDSGLGNIAEPLALDASEERWPIDRADAILCVNMLHISPWSATTSLFAGAAVVLQTGGKLILYGPFLEAGVETADSNLQFDDSLRQRNPDWGLRNTDDVDTVANEHGFIRNARYPMPANNLILVYRRS
ncbi:DUF938 domain-containing protein [Qipengyuania sp. JC766]|uniref:DUF938 domain-containing protein n=1 Tax=Qipengyuania sp. JC766 TaxID=3232139 RepID=UPI003459EDF8